jgi:hypothetical protein
MFSTDSSASSRLRLFCASSEVYSIHLAFNQNATCCRLFGSADKLVARVIIVILSGTSNTSILSRIPGKRSERSETLRCPRFALPAHRSLLLW